MDSCFYSDFFIQRKPIFGVYKRSKIPLPPSPSPLQHTPSLLHTLKMIVKGETLLLGVEIQSFKSEVFRMNVAEMFHQKVHLSPLWHENCCGWWIWLWWKGSSLMIILSVCDKWLVCEVKRVQIKHKMKIYHYIWSFSFILWITI